MCVSRVGVRRCADRLLRGDPLQFAVGFMFSAGIPLMMWLVAAMMLIGYWFDKWWLLRKSRKPPQVRRVVGVVHPVLQGAGAVAAALRWR